MERGWLQTVVPAQRLREVLVQKAHRYQSLNHLERMTGVNTRIIRRILKEDVTYTKIYTAERILDAFDMKLWEIEE